MMSVSFLLIPSHLYCNISSLSALPIKLYIPCFNHRQYILVINTWKGHVTELSIIVFRTTTPSLAAAIGWVTIPYYMSL